MRRDRAERGAAGRRIAGPAARRRLPATHHAHAAVRPGRRRSTRCSRSSIACCATARRFNLRVQEEEWAAARSWMTIERTPAPVNLHRPAAQRPEPFEASTGDASAFFGGDARDRERWVREFRRESSIDCFTPHITLGHASEPPAVEPIEFVAAPMRSVTSVVSAGAAESFASWDTAKAETTAHAVRPEPCEASANDSLCARVLRCSFWRRCPAFAQAPVTTGSRSPSASIA